MARKIKLHGSPTTKELKKKHSPMLEGGVVMGSQGRQDSWEGGGWQTKQSHTCVWISQEEQWGSETDHTTQVSSAGKIKTQNLWL